MLNQSPLPKKTRRNYSDLQQISLNLRDKDDNPHRHVRSISIKINRNKLPADFFPRTESLRKNRPSINKKYVGQSIRKAQSQRNHYSPEKTSFFGFMQEKQEKNNNSFKRKFQSREEPKRQKIALQHRNYTPMNGIQRSELLYLYPDRPDFEINEALTSSKKIKAFQMSPRKQRISKYRQKQQSIPMDPQNQEERQWQKNEQDVNNITFFNAKSTSFPPINRNQSST